MARPDLNAVETVRNEEISRKAQRAVPRNRHYELVKVMYTVKHSSNDLVDSIPARCEAVIFG